MTIGEMRELPLECDTEQPVQRWKFRKLESGLSSNSSLFSFSSSTQLFLESSEPVSSEIVEPNPQEHLDLLDLLPSEIREMILSSLIETKDWKSINRASRTNWRWRNEIDFLWKKFAVQSRLLEDEETWAKSGKNWKWVIACATNSILKDQPPQSGFGRTMRVTNEAQYEGEFKEGKKHGVGKMKWFNGDRFLGSWVEDSKQGYGTMLWENGDSYRGGWKSDLRDGFSTYVYANGGNFEGYYHNDERHGLGVFIWPDGDRFEGNWSSGGRKGKGIFTKKDGEQIEQDWNESPFVSYSVSLPSKYSEDSLVSN